MLLIYLGALTTLIFFIFIGLQNSLVRYRNRILSSIQLFGPLLDEREALVKKILLAHAEGPHAGLFDKVLNSLQSQSRGLKTDPFSFEAQKLFLQAESELHTALQQLEKQTTLSKDFQNVHRLTASIDELKLKCNEAIQSYNKSRNAFPNLLVSYILKYAPIATF